MEDLDNIELQDPNYTIYVFSYDENDQILGDHFVADFGSDATRAVDFAKLIDTAERAKIYAHKDAKYVIVEVETVVEVEDWTQNAGSIYYSDPIIL